MYPAYKLNKQGDNKQPWRTPFPIWNQSVVPLGTQKAMLFGVYSDGSTPCTWLSRIPLPPQLPGSPPQAFPTTISSLRCPQTVSPQLAAALTLWLPSNPYTPAPAAVLSRGLVSLSGVYKAGERIVHVILIPFRLSQISSYTLQKPQMLPLFPKQLPQCRDLTPASGPPPPRASPGLLALFFFSLLPSSYRVLCGTIYYFLVVRCSACSQMIFCRIFCVWRCIPDVSMERDVLHIHILLCRLGSKSSFYIHLTSYRY